MALISPVSLDEFDISTELIKLIEMSLAKNAITPIAYDLVQFKANYLMSTAHGFDFERVLSARAIDMLRWVAQIDLDESTRRRLLPIVVAMAGCALEPLEDGKPPASPAEVRGLLSIAKPDLDYELLGELSRSGLEHPMFRNIEALQRMRIFASIEKIVETKTIKEELITYLESLGKDRFATPKTSLVQAIGLESVKMLQDSRGRCGLLASLKQANACPNRRCGVGLAKSELVVLKHRRLVKCLGCGQPIVWVGDA